MKGESIFSWFENIDLSLEDLRIRIAYIFNIFFFLSFIPVVLFGIFKNDFLSVSFCLLPMTFLFISTILINKKTNLAYIISSCLVPSLGYVFALTPEAPFIAIYVQLLLTLIVWILIIPNKKLRFIYWFVNLFLLLAIYSVHKSFSLVIIPFLLIASLSSIFLLIVNFLEKQNLRLLKAISDQKSQYKKVLKLNDKINNKNKELQNLSYIIVHDLKRPLQTINSFSKLIRRGMDIKSKKEKEYFEYVEQAVLDIDVIIDEIMLMHKAEHEGVELSKIDLNEIIDEVSSFYNNAEILQKRIIIKKEKLPFIKGNKALLCSLFGNLISNAIKFQPKNKDYHTPNIKIWTQRNSTPGKVNIYVSDNGVGINENYIELLFEPFKRFYNKGEYEGTGLGLPICERVMNKHNGKIELYETSDLGTTFKLIFDEFLLCKNRKLLVSNKIRSTFS